MVVPAALSAGRLPAPPARAARVPVALSLALHGLAIVPLFLAAASGGRPLAEAALFVEFSMAAPGPAVEADGTDAPVGPAPSSADSSSEVTPEPPQELAAVKRPEEAAVPQPLLREPKPIQKPKPESEPEVAIDLPLPAEPPPVNVADLKPIEPPKASPKPKPAKPPTPPKPKVASASPAAKPVAPTPAATAPPTNGSPGTQLAAIAPLSSAIVWEGKPRYRVPPRPPKYPGRAVELGQQGEALVRVRLDPDGTAAEILLWRSSGFGLLDRAALAAVHGWHFLPAQRNGHPVAAWVEIPVRFHLR